MNSPDLNLVITHNFYSKPGELGNFARALSATNGLPTLIVNSETPSQSVLAGRTSNKNFTELAEMESKSLSPFRRLVSQGFSPAMLIVVGTNGSS